MKAHVKMPMTNEMQDLVDRIIERAEEQMNEQQKKAISRVMKLSCLILNEDFGFGAVRLNRYITEMTERIQKAVNTPEQWYFVDKKMETLGLPFPREDIEERIDHSRDLMHEKGRKFREYGGKR